MTASTPRIPDAARELLLELGLVVQNERKRRALTQAHVAEAAGISRVVISRLETGKPVESWALALVLEALGLGISKSGNEKTPR